MLERALELNHGERTVMRVRLLSRLCGAIYYTPERDRMRGMADEAASIADALDDPEARAYACVARRRALWDAAHLRERLAASTEMLTRAREVGNLELELQAHAWLVVDLLEAGDRDAVDAQIEAFTDGAERLRQPLYLWNVLVWRAMRAHLAGQLERAEHLASEALAAGASAEAVTAPQYYAVQLLAGVAGGAGRAAGRRRAARRSPQAARRARRRAVSGHSAGRGLDDRRDPGQ